AAAGLGDALRELRGGGGDARVGGRVRTRADRRPFDDALGALLERLGLGREELRRLLGDRAAALRGARRDGLIGARLGRRGAGGARRRGDARRGARGRRRARRGGRGGRRGGGRRRRRRFGRRRGRGRGRRRGRRRGGRRRLRRGRRRGRGRRRRH